MGTIRKAYRGSKNALILSIPKYMQDVYNIKAGDLIEFEIIKVHKKWDMNRVENIVNEVIDTKQDLEKGNKTFEKARIEK